MLFEGANFCFIHLPIKKKKQFEPAKSKLLKEQRVRSRRLPPDGQSLSRHSGK